MNILLLIASIITIIVAVIDLRPEMDKCDIVLTVFTIFAGVVAMLMGIMGLIISI